MSEIRRTDQYSSVSHVLLRQVGELARDVRDALLRRPRSTLYEVEAEWEEPFALEVGLSAPPRAVVLLRAVNNDGGADGKPSGLAWTWDANGRVQVDDVDGVTVGTNYTLTFEVIHA